MAADGTVAGPAASDGMFGDVAEPGTAPAAPAAAVAAAPADAASAPAADAAGEGGEGGTEKLSKHQKKKLKEKLKVLEDGLSPLLRCADLSAFVQR